MLWTSNTDLRNDLLSASSIFKLCRILPIGAWKYIFRLLMILTNERIIIFSLLSLLFEKLQYNEFA